MGASKKLMENVIMSYSKEIKITTARFANVAFSNGSLLYGYINRLMQRQPISCPVDIKRFFVSPEESGEICLLTCILGKTGDIYFPKLNSNQLVSFKSITEDFFNYINKKIVIFDNENEAKIAANNLTEDSAYPVYFFKTDTSGEKLFEEFFTKDDMVDLEKYHGIGVITNSKKPTKYEVKNAIDKLELLFKNEKYLKQDVIQIMNDLIPTFDHTETGNSLENKM